MEFKNIREENAVSTLIDMLKQGKYKKASVKLGELRGKPEEFTKLYNYLTEESRLKDVKLKIKGIKAKVKCMSCDWKGDPHIKPNHVQCPRCFSDVHILKGNEFQVHL